MTRVIEVPVTRVAIDELDLRFSPLRLFNASQQELLIASIRREGVRQPVLVATSVEPERHVVVDGFKRVRAARQLGVTHLSVSALALDGIGALAMMLRSNGPHRGMSVLEEGWVVRRLCREHGLTQDRAGTLLEREQSWVSHRLRLVEQLEESLQEDLRLGLMTPSVARELGRLPGSQQLSAAAAVHEQGLLSRQVARLVRVLLRTEDPNERREMLADPGRVSGAAKVASKPVATSDSRLTSGSNELRRLLLTFEGSASQLSDRLIGHASDDLAGEARRILAPVLRQAITAAGHVSTELTKAHRHRTHGADVAAAANTATKEAVHASTS